MEDYTTVQCVLCAEKGIWLFEKRRDSPYKFYSFDDDIKNSHIKVPRLLCGHRREKDEESGRRIILFVHFMADVEMEKKIIRLVVTAFGLNRLKHLHTWLWKSIYQQSGCVKEMRMLFISDWVVCYIEMGRFCFYVLWVCSSLWQTKRFNYVNLNAL